MTVRTTRGSRKRNHWKRSFAHRDPTFVKVVRVPLPDDEYPDPKAPDTSVYFVLDAEACQIKIGITEDVEERVKRLSYLRRRQLELLGSIPGGYDLERMFHRRFDDYRVEGREWYSSEIAGTVLAVLAAE